MTTVNLNTFKPFCFFLAFIASLSLLCGFALVAAEEGSTDSEPKALAKANEKYAVLVGVDEYEDSKLGRLQYTVQDIEIIYDELLEIGFEKDHIWTLKSRSGPANKPTRALIQDRIDKVFDLAGPNDMIFFAFAGHGTQIDDTVYFCTEDTYITDKEMTKSTAFSVSSVIKRFERSPARFKWLVIDACRNDPFSRGAEIPGSRGIQNLDDPPRGSAVLLSCAPGERSYEDKEFEHGLFSYSFVEGLKGAADREGNNDGELTLYELFSYTTRMTESRADKLQMKQRPYFRGESSDFIIIDGLLIEGLPKQTWDQADGLYQEACFLRRGRRYREAQVKIREALKLTEGALSESSHRQTYLDEEADIKERHEMQEQLEAEKKRRLEAEERARQPAGSQGETSLVPLVESSDAPDQSVFPIAPPTRVNKLGVGTRAGEKKTITANGIDYTFCWCPAGEFEMGSPETEEGRFDDEIQHRVTLTHGFWLLESEVTQGMWKSVMGTTISEQRSKDGEEDDRIFPFVGVIM